MHFWLKNRRPNYKIGIDAKKRGCSTNLNQYKKMTLNAVF